MSEMELVEGELVKESKVYLKPETGKDSMAKIPIDLVRILIKDGWGSGQIFYRYKKGSPRIVIEKGTTTKHVQVMTSVETERKKSPRSGKKNADEEI